MSDSVQGAGVVVHRGEVNDWRKDSLHTSDISTVPYKVEVEAVGEWVTVSMHRDGDPDQVGMELIIEVDSGVPRLLIKNAIGADDVQLSIHVNKEGFHVVSAVNSVSPEADTFTNSNGVSSPSQHYSFKVKRTLAGEAWEQAMKNELTLKEKAESEAAKPKPTSKMKF